MHVLAPAIYEHGLGRKPNCLVILELTTKFRLFRLVIQEQKGISLTHHTAQFVSQVMVHSAEDANLNSSLPVSL